MLVAHALSLVYLVVSLGLRPFDLYEGDQGLWILSGLALLLWSFEHVRRAPWGPLALAGVVAAALFAWWSGHLAFDREEPQLMAIRTTDVATLALMWCAFTLPPALLAAQRAWRPALLSGVGSAMMLASAGKIAYDYATTGDYRSDAVELLLQVAGTGLLCLGLWLAWRQPTPVPPVRLRIPATTLAGTAILLVSWARGGQLTFLVPLWILAVLVLAAPAFLAARHRPLRLLLVVALLVAGVLVPAAECTYPFVTDAPRPGDPAVSKVETEELWPVAGRGPWWTQDDLMASYRVRCEPAVPPLAIAWLLAIAIVAAAPIPEPRALRRLTGRA